MAAFRNTGHRKFVAWLALAALWLTIGMPVVAQLLPHGTGSLDLGSWCTPHGLSDHHSRVPSDPAAPTDKCGYCGLLCHSPLILGHAGPVLSTLSLPMQRLYAAVIAAGQPPRILSADPRGPPPLS